MFVCTECGASSPGQGVCPADGTALQPIGEDLLLGTTIGVYRVARLLGIGGMGRVYKGVHPSIGSRVAVKVLSRECSDRRDVVDRFFGEARAVNMIKHESIVNVLDLAMLPDGRPYIIMEYLDGAPLANIVEAANQRGVHLPLGGLARLCAEVLDALGAAHTKGIVHRDLKPDNIFVAPSGRPKVLDFGIAKLSDVPVGAATRTGSLLGTPHYMSPEQAAGRPVDHRADLYAIGVILFECATGHKPFQAESLFDLLRKHVEAPPPSPRSLRPDLPVELEHVILCALAKSPDERFANAHAMSMALQHATQRLSPDQWAPLSNPSLASTNPHAWAPTPPASWGGDNRATARPSVQPPIGPHSAPTAFVPPPAMQQAHQTTVSASSGQLTNPLAGQAKTTKSKAGLYIAMISIVVVIGGITAAVVAGGGDESKAASTSDEPIVDDKPTPDDKVEAKIDPPPNDKADTADDPADEAEHKADEAMEKAFEQLDDQIDSLPPEARAQLEKLRGMNKLAPNERLERIRKMQEELAKNLNKDLAEAMSDVPGGMAGTKLAGGGGNGNGWFTRHDVSPPGVDWKKLDVDKYIDWAVAEAKKNVPDAQMTWISVEGVRADGTADLTLDDGDIDVRFISPAKSKRDPNIPRGVKQERICEFRILGGPDGAEIYEMFATDCKTATVPRPKCTLKQVWKKALAKKSNLGNAVAEIGYRSNIVSKQIRWFFSISDDGDTLISEQFPDDC